RLIGGSSSSVGRSIAVLLRVLLELAQQHLAPGRGQRLDGEHALNLVTGGAIQKRALRIEDGDAGGVALDDADQVGAGPVRRDGYLPRLENAEIPAAATSLDEPSDNRPDAGRHGE